MNIKLIDNILIPGFIKALIIKKYGVDKVLSNYNEYSKQLNLFETRYITLIINKYLRNDLKKYFSNLDLSSSYEVEKLEKILNDLILPSTRTKILKNMPFNKCYDLLFKIKNNFTADSLYLSHKREMNKIINDDIKNNKVSFYLSSCESNIVQNKIIKKADIETLVNDVCFITESRFLINAQKLREKEIQNYILKDIKNNNCFEKYLFSNLIYEKILSKIFEMYDIPSTVIGNLIEKRNKSYEILCKKYPEKINKYLDEVIKNKEYEKYLRLSYENLAGYIIKHLPIDELIEFLKRNYINDFIFNKFTTLRTNDIVNFFVNNDLKELENIELSYQLILRIVEKVDINNDNIGIFVQKGNDDVIRYLNNYYQKELLNYIKKQSENDLFYKKFYSENQDFKLIRLIFKDYTKVEIIKLLECTLTKKEYLDIIFELKKEEVLEIFEDLSDYNKKKIFVHCYNTEFRKYLIENMTLKFVFENYEELSAEEKNYYYEKRYDELLAYLQNIFNINMDFFFKAFVNIKDDKIQKLSLSLFSDDDLVKNFKNTPNILIESDQLKLRIMNIVRTKSNQIIYGDYVECVNFLKGLRSYSNDIFKELLFNSILDDNILYKLITERGLSNEQKEILYNFKKDEINNLIEKKLNEDSKLKFDLIQKGTPKELLDIALSYYSKEELNKLLDNDDFIKRKSVGQNFAIELCYLTYKDAHNIDKVKNYINGYSKDTFKLIKNFEIIEEFLKDNDIDSSIFLQYALNDTYDFTNDMVYIYQNNKELFKKVNKYFNDNIFEKDNIYSFNNFLLMVKNFIRYKDLCIDVANSNNLNKNYIKKILMTFNLKNTFSINKIEDCENIIEILKENLMDKYRNCCSALDYKKLFQDIFFIFDGDHFNLEDAIFYNGNLATLKTLKIYNKYNKNVVKEIEQLEYFTEKLEYIIKGGNIEEIKKYILERINNLEEMTNFDNRKYKELVRKVYALEMKENLTKINDETSRKFVINEEASLRYNVPVYNFTNKAYILLAHVQSSSETTEELVNGISNGNKNFISLSAISYRNQAYYYGGTAIIFGYDDFNLDNFICSSGSNMGSNYQIKNNSINFDSFKNIKRGVLETSDSDSNSEILCLREGLKPKYIIVPDFRMPTSTEIEIAKRYNLIICLTQGKKCSIEEPLVIPHDEEVEALDVFKPSNIAILKNYDEKAKIGILTDVHGLMEPTISILEDMKLNGVDEIYSLGDNIGTGSNPSEVVDIMNNYGVKNIKGNHELYLLDGILAYEKHLRNTGAFEEEEFDSSWTKSKLREDQIETIKNYDNKIELELAKKRILLCHYIYDYNNDELIVNPEEYDYVLQGHKHFKNKSDNIITLRAAGIGFNGINDIGKASYLLLTEKDSGLIMEDKMIPYQYKNTIGSLNCSNNKSKTKMINWIKGR